MSFTVGTLQIWEIMVTPLLQVMTNQEACDCIRDVDDAQKASKKLVKEAKSLGSYDDISCIVVMF